MAGRCSRPRVVARFGIERIYAGDGGVGREQQHVARGFRLHDLLDRDVSFGAGLVVYDHRAGQGPAQVFSDDACRGVGGRTRLERDHDSQGPVGRQGAPGQEGRGQHGAQKQRGRHLLGYRAVVLDALPLEGDDAAIRLAAGLLVDDPRMQSDGVAMLDGV
ncbi:hypothetical protein G6F68_013854 [Rhizopus microsporus]|nr:hypothetical protein G6F68_013854 [Rhizopus microsporus]